MPKYVALLRGIAPMNPNMHNDKLRTVCEDLGFTNVKSVIASGNLLFESPIADSTKIEAMLEVAWPKKLDFSSTTIVRGFSEIESLIKTNPFKGYEHGPSTYLNVTFLKRKPDAHALSEGTGFQIVGTFDQEVCSVIDMTSGKTPNFMTKAEQQYGKQITTRTWKTVERIFRALQ